MTPLPSALLPLVFFGYTVVGSAAFGLWLKRTRRRQRVSMPIGSSEWYKSQLRVLIVVEVVVLFGALLFVALIPLTTRLPQSPDYSFWLIGSGIGLGFFAAFFVIVDLFFVVRIRRFRRQPTNASH